jgi:hypothetical protein
MVSSLFRHGTIASGPGYRLQSAGAALALGKCVSSRGNAFAKRRQQENDMKTWIAMSAAAALLAGVTIASAQNTSTPGAGAAGQDERGADMEGSSKTPGTPKVKDAPPSVTTGAAAPRVAPKAPAMNEKSSIHQSAGDRDSRGTPKQ